MKRKYSAIKLKSKPQGEVSIPIPQITGNNVISFDTLSGFFSAGGDSGSNPIVVTDPTTSIPPVVPSVDQANAPSDVVSNSTSVANEPPSGDPAQVNIVDQSKALISKVTNPTPTPKIDIEHDPLPSEVKQAENYIDGQIKLPMGITPIDNESFMSNITYLDIGNYDPREVYKAEKSKDKKEGGGKIKNMIDAYLTMEDLKGTDLVDLARNTYNSVDRISKFKRLYDISEQTVNHLNYSAYDASNAAIAKAKSNELMLQKLTAKRHVGKAVNKATEMYMKETDDLFYKLASNMSDYNSVHTNAYDMSIWNTRPGFKPNAVMHNSTEELLEYANRTKGRWNSALIDDIMEKSSQKIVKTVAKETGLKSTTTSVIKGAAARDPLSLIDNTTLYKEAVGRDYEILKNVMDAEPRKWKKLVAQDPGLNKIYEHFKTNQGTFKLSDPDYKHLLGEQLVKNNAQEAIEYAGRSAADPNYVGLTPTQIDTLGMARRIELQLKGVPVLNTVIAASPGTIGGITAQLVKAAPEFIIPIVAMKAIEKSADVANMTYMKMRTDGMKIDDDILNSGVLSDFFDLAGNALSISNPEKLIPGIAKSAYSIAYPQMKQMTKDYQNKMSPEGFLSKNWENFKDPDQFWKLVSHNFYEDKNFVDQLRVAYDKLQLPPQKPKASENEAPLASQFIENYIYNIYHHGKYLIKSGWESLTWKNIGDGIKGAAKWFLHRLNPLTMPKEAAQIAKFVLYDSPKFQIKGAYKTAKYFMGNTGEWKKQLREVFGNAKSYSNPEKINKLYEQYTGEAKDKESIADLYGRYVGAMIDPSLAGKVWERAGAMFRPAPVPEPATIDPDMKEKYINESDRSGILTVEQAFTEASKVLAESGSKEALAEAEVLFLQKPDEWQDSVLAWLRRLNDAKGNKVEYIQIAKEAPEGYYKMLGQAHNRVALGLNKKLS